MRNLLVRLVLAAGCLPVSSPARGQSSSSDAVGDTAWVARSALYEVFVQDFSPQGTLRGVIEGLDRIQSTGANVVWLMPIHPIGVLARKGTLGSPYAVKDYRAVNPAYGTADDFRALVGAVHGRGMKLILDWVPDHTSMDHPWIRQHPEFYFRNERGEPSPPREPNGKLTDWTDVAQLDYGNAGVRREMIAAMRWWLEQYGIDGFRVDVAGFLPNDFWREAVPALRAAAPHPIMLLAEWDDPELHRLGYDLTYGWDSYDRLKDVWQGGPASAFVLRAVADLKTLPAAGARMRFTTNHDKTAWDEPPLKLFHGSAGARAAYVAVALLPGRPLLYNGQEVESPQKLGLFERESVTWTQPRAAEAQAFYRKIVELARDNPSFIGRDLTPVTTSSPKDVIAYRRGDAIVLVNARSRALRFMVTGTSVDGATDLLSNRVQRGDTIALPAYGAVVLHNAPGKVGRSLVPPAPPRPIRWRARSSTTCSCGASATATATAPAIFAGSSRRWAISGTWG